MYTEPELLNKRLERLAMVLDEIMPNCALLVRDALELLKEQEAVKPKCKERMGGFVVGLCPTCGTALNNVLNVKACGKCGQAVKWE